MAVCQSKMYRLIDRYRRQASSHILIFSVPDTAPGSPTSSSGLPTQPKVVSSEGRSWISFADYAIALIDEVESPKHSRQRFTVGY